jgi:hypothetical protein
VKIVKRILIGLGVVFALIIVVAGFLGYQSHRFRVAQEPFVRTFMTDLARRWDGQDVYDRLTNGLIEQLGSSQGKAFLDTARHYGQVMSITDFELNRYNATPSATQVNFRFKAKFTNGTALIDVYVIDRDHAIRVDGVHVIEGHLSSGVTPTSSV